MFTVLRQARYLALIAIGVVLAVGCVVAGVWQVHRYGQKHDSNAVLRHNDAVAPVPVADLLAPSREVGAADRLRRVTAHGRYDTAHQVFVRQRQVDNQPAFLVLTPLRTDEGPTLLVVRGWTTIQGSATQTPTVPPPPDGEVAVVGRVNPSEPAGSVRAMPSGQVERINVPSLGRRIGAPVYGGYVELVSQQPAEHGVKAMPTPDLSNPAGGAFEGQHLAYVVQWFLFAALALAAPPLLAWLEARRIEAEGPPGGSDAPGPEGPVRPDPTDVLAEPPADDHDHDHDHNHGDGDGDEPRHDDRAPERRAGAQPGDVLPAVADRG